MARFFLHLGLARIALVIVEIAILDRVCRSLRAVLGCYEAERSHHDAYQRR